jgi:hypothetical protein
MRWLTLDAVVLCGHQPPGRVGLVQTQSLVHIDGRPVLVRSDPEQRPISGCPSYGPGIKPCLLTLQVQRGYSDWTRIDGHPVCLDTVTGFTDGSPPGVVTYSVSDAGQTWIDQR